MSVKTFDWSDEINQVVTKSLVTTFGLDFLFFEDKKGGDVDTIHNVRQGIWATEEEKKKYENKGDYKPIELGNDGNPLYDNNGKLKRKDVYRNGTYRERGKKDAKLKDNGQLADKYRNKTMKLNEDRQLDHVISASEIHHDAGRILAEKDGVKLANEDINLTSTHRYINNIKRDHSPEKFFNEIVPQKINQQKIELNNKLEKTFRFNNYNDVVAFSNKVMEIAIDQDHHPEIHNHYNYVKVRITDYDKARALLLQSGSVKNAVDAFRS